MYIATNFFQKRDSLKYENAMTCALTVKLDSSLRVNEYRVV